jgi:hypothetical protein
MNSNDNDNMRKGTPEKKMPSPLRYVPFERQAGYETGRFLMSRDPAILHPRGEHGNLCWNPIEKVAVYAFEDAVWLRCD